MFVLKLSGIQNLLKVTKLFKFDYKEVYKFQQKQKQIFLKDVIQR